MLISETIFKRRVPTTIYIAPLETDMEQQSKLPLIYRYWSQNVDVFLDAFALRSSTYRVLVHVFSQVTQCTSFISLSCSHMNLRVSYRNSLLGTKAVEADDGALPRGRESGKDVVWKASLPYSALHNFTLAYLNYVITFLTVFYLTLF